MNSRLSISLLGGGPYPAWDIRSLFIYLFIYLIVNNYINVEFREELNKKEFCTMLNLGDSSGSDTAGLEKSLRGLWISTRYQ